MGLLDTLEGIATGAGSDESDEDHIEDALDGGVDALDEAGDLMDDVGGAADALGLGGVKNALGGASSAVSDVAGVVGDVQNFLEDVMGELKPQLLPTALYYFKVGEAQNIPDPGLWDELDGTRGIAHMGDNLLNKALGSGGGLVNKIVGGGGLLKGAAAALGSKGVDGFEHDVLDPAEWYVHEFHCTEGLNELFEMRLVLVRREHEPGKDLWAGKDANRPIDDLTIGKGSGPLGFNLGAPIAAINQIANDVLSGNDQALLKDLTKNHRDPNEHMLDIGIEATTANLVDPDKFLNHMCSVHLSRPMEDGHVVTERWFSGICSEFEDLGYLDGGMHLIRLKVVPSLWKLALRKNCRIFENLNAIQIVTDVLKQAGIYTNSVKKIAAKVVPGLPFADSDAAWTVAREYCVQYNETDLEFVLRLLAEEGVSYYFDHHDMCERLILIDNAKATGHKCKTIDEKPVGLSDSSPVATDTIERVWDYGLRQKIITTKVTLRDFNFSVPDTKTESAAGHGAQVLSGGSLLNAGELLGGLADTALGGGARDHGDDAEAYTYPGRLTFELEEKGAIDAKYKRYSGADVAKYQLKALRSEEDIGEGRSNLVNLMAGSAMRLRWLDPRKLAGKAQREAKRGDKLIMTRVEHIGIAADKLTPDADPQAISAADVRVPPGYRNVFHALNSKTTPIKPRPRPSKPVIAGLQSATVIDKDSKAENNDDARFILEHLGISKYFACVFVSSEIGADKPHPEIYRCALNLMNLKPNEALHVGDDSERDWKAAAKAGLSVFKLDRQRNSLRELLTILKL